MASQLPNPGVHANPQISAAQVAVAFGGAAHGVHATPHPPGSLTTHRAPQAWLGALHAVPQTSFEHVATPPGGAGQTVQPGPHAVGSFFAAHLPSQARKPA